MPAGDGPYAPAYLDAERRPSLWDRLLCRPHPLADRLACRPHPVADKLACRPHPVKDRLAYRASAPGPLRNWVHDNEHPVWQWATYRELPNCYRGCCPEIDPCIFPPLYTFFLDPACQGCASGPQAKCHECGAFLKALLSRCKERERFHPVQKVIERRQARKAASCEPLDNLYGPPPLAPVEVK
jgi:hypothetical protein